MNEIQSSIYSFLKHNLSFVPTEYWLPISVALGTIIGIMLVVGRVTSAIVGLHTLVTKFFRKKKVVPVISPDPARVLRAVWLRDRNVANAEGPSPPKTEVPIISFLNMKGGVGKTTLAANIGAHFHHEGARVLYIDFDYQGTLSLMVASTANQDRLENNSYKLLQNKSYREVSSSIHRFSSLPNIGLFAAHYVLFRDEMELFANWAANNSTYDIRYALKHILHSDDCSKDWDVIVIDCGPRFTTSTINALCASTHVVVPAILDEPSAQAVGYLSKELDDHRLELFPDLKLLGVIPTMIAQDPKHKDEPTFNDVEEEQLGTVADKVAETWGDGDFVLREARIPRRAPISKNADKIAYTVDGEAKRVFGRAADILLERLGHEGFRTSWNN